MWWMVAGAQMGMGLYSGRQAKSAARKQARREANVYYKTAQENIRRLDRTQKQNEGAVLAGIGASGFTMSGTQLQYANDVSREQKQQLDWEKRAAELNRQSILKGGKAQGDSLYQASILQGISSGINAYQSYSAQRAQV